MEITVNEKRIRDRKKLGEVIDSACIDVYIIDIIIVLSEKLFKYKTYIEKMEIQE